MRREICGDHTDAREAKSIYVCVRNPILQQVAVEILEVEVHCVEPQWAARGFCPEEASLQLSHICHL